MDRPNICLIMSDDHAAHAVSAYGSVVNQTPRIDEIAAHGRRVDRCCVANALCSPSRATILTGTHSHVNGVTTLLTFMDNSQPTFASELQKAGYRTGLFGKWHLGEGPNHEPRGFDTWAVLRDQGEYFDPELITAEGSSVHAGYTTDVLTDLALDWLGEGDPESPWLLLLYHKAPHRPWEPHPKYADHYTGRIPVPATFFDDFATRSEAARAATMRVDRDLTATDLKRPVPHGLSAREEALWKYQRYMEDYLACVDSVDESVGRVIDALRARGEFDDTLLLYTSDQGFFLGDHGWYDKRFMYEESLRMPLVVSWPNQIPAGPPVTALVSNVDFAQTFLDAAGVPALERMQGESMLPLLRGEPVTTRDALYYRYWTNDDPTHHVRAHYGICTDRHKLIHYYGDGFGLPDCSDRVFEPEWEMFDTLADPLELVNVADDPAYADTRAHLTARLAELQREAGDQPYPVPGSLSV